MLEAIPYSITVIPGRESPVRRKAIRFLAQTRNFVLQKYQFDEGDLKVTIGDTTYQTGSRQTERVTGLLFRGISVAEFKRRETPEGIHYDFFRNLRAIRHLPERLR